MPASDVALDWWQAFGEGAVEPLWRLSSKPVRYMLARSMIAGEVNTRAAEGDDRAATELLVACQTVAVHGPRGPAWGRLDQLCVRFFEPIDMGPLLAAMRLFPRTEDVIGSFTQVTFHPPDTPAMPWIVDLDERVVVGFARVLRGSEDAAALGERVSTDRLALWSAA